ncbi:MAG: hypothetical protein ACTSVY_06640 [Candidatus Helarchaeota archaeon]
MSGIGIARLKELINELHYDNLIISEVGTLFIQFQPKTSDENKIERLKNWFWNKVNNEMIPKYNTQFNLTMKAKNFPTHIEITKMFQLPEEKVKKFFNLFKWIKEKL